MKSRAEMREAVERHHTVVHDYWYRYHDVRYAAPLDEWDEPVGEGRTAIRLYKIQILSTTPKGVWIDWPTNFSDKKFVLRDARKRFACPTKEDAMESFLARKKRQSSILFHQRKHVEEAIVLAETGQIE